MDRIIYTAGGGAARVLEQQATISNNLANATTTGFREQLALQRSVYVRSADTPVTRVASLSTAPGSNFAQGVLNETGRPLDLAIRGEGWFTVQKGDEQVFTRAGEFTVNANNQLVSSNGHWVLSIDDAPIEIPERGSVTFGADGTISAIGAGDNPSDIQEVGRLKLVNPDLQQLRRGDDGYFRMADNAYVAADENVGVVSGFLEKSNVSVAQTMVGLIQNARHFETQMKVIQQASSNAERANSILASGH